ncbi:unnamed protein product [Pneumocystis jirovecii]|uniref:Monopolin complex subunit Csm1/Pcs1 C-terminal domain-containing protein n=1 Tax=Pneumocystis jirovecii TaxID=42068 RepID=L0P8V1_PNEJI|nr:unnamed protein product [Pneumocystis jirovecii]
MGKKQAITSKKAECSDANNNSTIHEREDKTSLSKTLTIRKLHSFDKENLPLGNSGIMENVNRKKRSQKNIFVEKGSKSSQKENVLQEMFQVQLNDSKCTFIDVYDNSIAIEERLEEAIKKMEEFEKKYICLKDLRQTEVESNFFAYREVAESRFKVSEVLIDSLTKNIDAKDKKLNDLLSHINNLELEKKEFEKLSEKLKFTEQALVHANSQISYLNAKFSSRSSASISQLKEDLYSDLTGLLIRDVKLESKKTVFDCLQTGRNGTLHFKLSLFVDPSCQSQERFSYTPLFDEERDAPLLNYLPNYLTDEIIFEKDQAAMFNWRLSSALQKKD